MTIVPNAGRSPATVGTVIPHVVVLVLTLACAAGARAQATDVLVRIDASDPIAEATLRELAQRGLNARSDDPTASDGAHELQVAALALGARAVVWVEQVDAEISVHVLRADDGERGVSRLSAPDVRAEPRLAALVAGALLEEILSRAHAAPEPATELATPTWVEPHPAPRPAVRVAPAPSGPHPYATFSTEGWARFEPQTGGGMSMRASTGVEWPDGARIGAQLRLVPGTDAMRVETELVQRVATAFLGGAEVVGRFGVPHHALLVGVSAVVGPTQRVDATGQEIWDVAVLAGGLIGFAFPIGLSTEMGVHLGIDLRFEPSRNVAWVPSLGVRWDWR